MKIKIKSYYGDLPEYLTLGKVYEFDKWSDDNDGSIQDDIGIGLYIFLDECDFLGGGSWEVVDNEGVSGMNKVIDLVEKCNER